jgi:hypothetical protein
MTETPAKRGPKPTALSMFLALKPGIAEALKAGLKRRTLYEKHSDALGVGYPQFTRYVKRYILNETPQPPKGLPRVEKARPVSDDETQNPVRAPARTGPISTASQTPRKFEFDPTRANRPGRDKELF